MSHEELEHSYTVEVGDRKQLDTGSVKYPVKVVCDDTEETIVDTTYTVSKRQEEQLEKMLTRFAEKKALEYEHDLGEDHSGRKLVLGP